MEKTKVNKKICAMWILVPVLSFWMLSRPVLEVHMDAGLVACAEIPYRIYNGFQLLIHGSLTTPYGNMVADFRNPGFVLLKMMVLLQLIFDGMILYICIREWRKNQTCNIFLRLRGILSLGYMATSIAIFQFAQVCAKYPMLPTVSPELYISAGYQCQYEWKINIICSAGIVFLFFVTWIFFGAGIRAAKKSPGIQ